MLELHFRSDPVTGSGPYASTDLLGKSPDPDAIRFLDLVRWSHQLSGEWDRRRVPFASRISCAACCAPRFMRIRAESAAHSYGSSSYVEDSRASLDWNAGRTTKSSPRIRPKKET